MAFLGMRGTGDWATDERPMNYRESILYLYPNGSAPLTGIMSKLSNEKVDDPHFHWWTKLLPQQGGSITAGNVYSDSGLSSAYVSGGVVGSILYIKMAASATLSASGNPVAGVDEFRPGHQVTIRLTTDLTLTCNAKVVEVVSNGTSSYLAVKLLEADDNSTPGNTLASADTVFITGNLNPEGGAMPESIEYDPTEWDNYTQIFRTPMSITRTAKRTKLRTGDAYKKIKREALELHSIEMERGFLWGIPTQNTGFNGKPERTTMGLINAIKIGAPSNVFDFKSDANFAGDDWMTGGEDWLDTSLEVIFRYGSMEKLAFVGSGTLLAIQKLAKATGQINLVPTTTDYGIEIIKWITPFGVINLKTHPLFSANPADRNTMIVFEPEKLIYRYIDDTTFYADGEQQNTGRNHIDGTEEEYLTEAGLEYHHPLAFGYLTGFNQKNTAG